MRNLNIPVGISDFARIRSNNYYYVDKSGFLAELLQDEATQVTLLTRPRRFGKTLAMSMAVNFFDIRKDSRQIFEGLKITKQPALCQKWMNQYPTVFFSFKDVDGLDFENAYGMLRNSIIYGLQEYDFLLQSDAVSKYDKEIFTGILQKRASAEDIKMCFLLLTRMLYSYYQKPVILLIDEYDVPVSKASSKGYYNEMLDVMRAIMGTALKDNPFLKFAVVTGCLRIAKDSIFTGMNNFVLDTISSPGLHEYFGFTENDVHKILQDAGAEEYAGKMKAWYDGYHFGDSDVYCPWDVMNYVRDIQRNPSAEPVSYWKNTSDNAVIRSFIDYAGSSITVKLEKLLAGGYISQRVDENLTYDYLHSSEDNLWSVLYLTGYLTSLRKNELPDSLPDAATALIIPNAEIKEIFETTIMKWFDDSAKNWNRQKLFDAVWEGDCETITAEMGRLLRRTISYHDYKEDFYHAFLAGIFTGTGYMVESNREHGEGRSDVVIYDSVNGKVAVFEIKYSKSMSAMERDCDTALYQIDEKMYAKDYEDSYDIILCYGISFYKKRCLIKQR